MFVIPLIYLVGLTAMATYNWWYNKRVRYYFVSYFTQAGFGNYYVSFKGDKFTVNAVRNLIMKQENEESGAWILSYDQINKRRYDMEMGKK